MLIRLALRVKMSTPVPCSDVGNDTAWNIQASVEYYKQVLKAKNHLVKPSCDC